MAEADRHKHDPEASWNLPHKPKSKKDTRRWCKGKVGREHTPAIERSHGERYPNGRPCQRIEGYTWALGCHHHEVCTTCGKILRWTIPYEECPDLA